MATLKTTNGDGRFFDDNSREDSIEYILRLDKIKHNYYGGIAVDMQYMKIQSICTYIWSAMWLVILMVTATEVQEKNSMPSKVI